MQKINGIEHFVQESLVSFIRRGMVQHKKHFYSELQILDIFW